MHGHAFPLLVLAFPIVASLIAACGAPAAPSPAKPSATAPPVSAPGAAAATAPASPAPAVAARPALPTTPRVDLKVGVLPLSTYGAHYIAHERGYFDEVGLNVELISAGNLNELLPSLMQGQIQVGACTVSIGCFNAMNRRTDVAVVADLSSNHGPSPKSDAAALVVRKDLWDAGTIRGPRDLVGRQVYTIAGEGSGAHLVVARWLRGQGIDPQSVEYPQLLPPDVLAAMGNRGAVETAVQYEPLLTAGLTRDIHVRMAGYQEMSPAGHSSFLIFHRSVDRLGPQVGERFMVAFLRGLRDYVNAMEYGVDQDAVIQVMINQTTQKDPAVYRQTRYNYADPNGDIDPASIQADADLVRDLGLAKEPIDLNGMFDDKYRKFAVQYLGEYQPPR